MSLSTSPTTSSAYAGVNAGGSGSCPVLRAIEQVPGAIASGVADVGEAVGDVASATVSFSERAMHALASGGMAVVHGVEDVIAFPFEMAAEIAVGAEHALEGGAHLIASGVSAAIDGVEAVASGVARAAHAVAVDLPKAIADDVASLSQTAMGDATTVAGAAAGVAMLTGTSPLKVISAIF